MPKGHPGVHKVECICKTCGKAFMKWPFAIRDGRGKFCSRQCKGIFHAPRLNEIRPPYKSGPDNPRWNGRREERPCPVCGRTMAKPTITCSRSCGQQLSRPKMRFDRNVNFKTEEIWKTRHYRELVLKDGAQCSQC